MKPLIYPTSLAAAVAAASPALAQTVTTGTGGDLSQVAQNVITWLGSGAAGRFLLLANIVACILAACHLTSWRTPFHTLVLSGLAWMASYAVSTWIGWSVG
jgi:hypothetical protein